MMGPVQVTSWPMAPGVAVDGMVACETSRLNCTSSENCGYVSCGMYSDFVCEMRERLEYRLSSVFVVIELWLILDGTGIDVSSLYA